MRVTPFRLSTVRKGLLLALRPWLWSVRPLHARSMLPDPIAQFAAWYRRALRCLTLEFPDAMCLSTIDENGSPDGRFVLLKGFDDRGFVFFTNAESRKGRSLAQRPQAALSFYWEPLQRQVRVQGNVEEASAAEADEYFASRARLSRIGAWASQQSRPLSSYAELRARVKEFQKKYPGSEIPRPPYWRGYRVIPRRIEFWQLRANRLHDRFVYERQDEGQWRMQRLYP